MWKTLEELEKYLYMSQDETLRRVGQSLITLLGIVTGKQIGRAHV